VQTVHGERLIWTTFSADQADLNYAEPEVLFRMIEVLLLYIERGAEIIRLDAIAYLWKKLGTSCIHLEETHRVVKLLRAILDAVAPHAILITETNVPHEENVSYFGDGSDEAQIVYQFPLPPLTVHAMHTGDATRLSAWASALSVPSVNTTFFNFLASHDGIGMRPAEGILTPDEVQSLVDRTLANGGYASFKTNADSSRSVYELNISFFDALCDPTGSESIELQVQRFLVSQAIMLVLAGVPGIYLHSLFGSQNYHAGVEQTGHFRSINREKLNRSDFEQELSDPDSLRNRIFHPYLQLIQTRTAHPAFHPNGPQRVLSLHPSLFTVLRSAPDGSETLLCIHNVSANTQPLPLCLGVLPIQHNGLVRDVISDTTFPVGAAGELELQVEPYQMLWLTGETE
jgi:sucrose phosphorylase